MSKKRSKFSKALEEYFGQIINCDACNSIIPKEEAFTLYHYKFCRDCFNDCNEFISRNP